MTLTPIPIVLEKGVKNIHHKFILLESGELLYGMCPYHKDLGDTYIRTTGNDSLHIIGAGTIPNDVRIPIENEGAWGSWKSTGYNVVTPLHLRAEIRDTFIKTLHSTAGRSA